MRRGNRACREQGVATHWTAPSEQKYGLYIESMIGARLGAVSLSSDGRVDEFTRRDGRRPRSTPMQTLRELERRIAAEIAGDYHLEHHDALRRAPIDAWKEHEPGTLFRAPRDCMRFRLSLLPEEQCDLRAEGVHVLGQTFWSRSLGSDFEAGVENVCVKFDPRDLACVYVQRPAGRYVVARNTRRPHSSSERDAEARSRSDPPPPDDDATHACARKCRSACPFAALAAAS
jgi:putative transposase